MKRLEFIEKYGCKLTLRNTYSKDSIVDGCISHKYETGGAEGGNCWGSEATSYTTNDSNRDFVALEDLILEVAPKIGFLQFKRLYRLVKSHEHTEYEYYGNYTNYTTLYIRLDELWDALDEMGVWDD